MLLFQNRQEGRFGLDNKGFARRSCLSFSLCKSSAGCCGRFSPVNQAIESGSAAPLLGIRAEDGVSVCKREASNASLVACCSALRL